MSNFNTKNKLENQVVVYCRIHNITNIDTKQALAEHALIRRRLRIKQNIIIHVYYIITITSANISLRRITNNIALYIAEKIRLLRRNVTVSIYTQRGRQSIINSINNCSVKCCFHYGCAALRIASDSQRYVAIICRATYR